MVWTHALPLSKPFGRGNAGSPHKGGDVFNTVVRGAGTGGDNCPWRGLPSPGRWVCLPHLQPTKNTTNTYKVSYLLIRNNLKIPPHPILLVTVS
jgi:hypothetical protein